jgi:hypothetical protein
MMALDTDVAKEHTASKFGAEVSARKLDTFNGNHFIEMAVG